MNVSRKKNESFKLFMTQKIFHQDVSKFHVRYFPDSSCKESALINYWREISEVLRVVTFVLNPYGGSRSSAVEIKFPFCLKGLIPKGIRMTVNGLVAQMTFKAEDFSNFQNL